MHTPFMDKSPHARGSAGGRLRHRLAHILTRSTCTTNTTSTAATSATAFVSLAKTTDDDSSHHQEAEAPPSPYFCTPCTYERPKVDSSGRPRRSRSRSRSASLVHISVDCTGGAGAASGRRSFHSDAPLLLQPQQHRSVPARDVRRTRQSKGGGRGTGKPVAARSPPSASRRHQHCSSSSASSWGRARRPSWSTHAAPYSWSSSASSTATDEELAPSSGEEEADTGTLFSSLSLSSDSTSEFYHTGGRGRGSAANTNTRRGHSNHHRNTARRHAPRRALPRASDPAPTPPDAFRPLVSVEASERGECGDERNKGAGNAKKPVGAAAAEEEETGAGMAVVKRSSNPYLDFRSSMVEMVVERRIGSVGQMEELLGSYLSLNSPRHHPAILAAFEDVWEAVFGEE